MDLKNKLKRHIDYYESSEAEDDYNFSLIYSYDLLNTTSIDIEDPLAMFNQISKSLENTMSITSFISILRHFLLIKNKSEGYKYWNTIDLLVQQIVLQLDGKNIDIEKEFIKLDMREIIEM